MAEAPVNTGSGGDSPSGDGNVPSPALEHVGDTIGPYHLIDVLGEGGFGVVFLAERRDHIFQRVALKVVKPGMDSGAVVARFTQERQALALLDHPNIAKVMDAGATPLGRPYFVMEVVQGPPLTTFATSRRLSVRDRLDLFLQVCRAVQHAHSRGLIHRDLKPSNILVAGSDGKSVPKVIDFGVVKALQASLSGRTVHTAEGQAIGTPQYMSPEQADGGRGEADERADVYSLGVVLFELLTGRLPFDEEVLRRAPIGTLSKVLEAIPVTPAGTLNPELRDDVETIILTAMQKDRERRYPSVAALAEDIERYLAGLPIHARRDSPVYIARRHVRRAAQRETWILVFSSFAIAVLITGLLATPLLFRWTSLGGAHRAAVARVGSWFVPGQPMDNVLLLALTDDHPPSELAATLGLEGVRDDDKGNLRGLHATMLTRLAAARPRAILYDMFPKSPSAHDAAFAESFRRLDAQRVPWAVSLERWAIEERPEVIEFLRNDPAARYGCAEVAPLDPEIVIDMAVRRGHSDVAPSAIAVLLAQLKHPGVRYEFELNEANQELIIKYWTPGADDPTRRVTAAAPDVFRLTNVQPVQNRELGTANSSLQPGDVLGVYTSLLPSDEALAAHTMDYATALNLTPDALAAAVAGKIIVVGDLRAVSRDVFPLGDRSIPGPQALAAAVDQVLVNNPTVTPDVFVQWEVMIGAAFLGAVIGRWNLGRPGRRWLLLAAAGALMVGASIGCYIMGIDWNPIPPFFAVVVASGSAVLVARVLIGPGRAVLTGA